MIQVGRLFLWMWVSEKVETWLNLIEKYLRPLICNLKPLICNLRLVGLLKELGEKLNCATLKVKGRNCGVLKASFDLFHDLK